ncbi:MAG: HK97 gp10 family phage protein, partial [Paenisporosarcina sp.]
MITVTTRGSWDNIERYLKKTSSPEFFAILDKYGAQGVAALAAATPTDSGLTAQSWFYEIKRTKNYYSIRWKNSNIVDGIPIAVLIQYGHGTGTGGYVVARDYINPVVRPLFEQILNE